MTHTVTVNPLILAWSAPPASLAPNWSLTPWSGEGPAGQCLTAPPPSWPQPQLVPNTLIGGGDGWPTSYDPSSHRPSLMGPHWDKLADSSSLFIKGNRPAVAIYSSKATSEWLRINSFLPMHKLPREETQGEWQSLNQSTVTKNFDWSNLVFWLVQFRKESRGCFTMEADPN